VVGKDLLRSNGTPPSFAKGVFKGAALVEQRGIPVTLVSGFVGAGKTTLINRLLRSGNRRYAVVIDDFGDASIDAAILKDAGKGGIVELPGGCPSWYETGRNDLLRSYLGTCLCQAWKAQRVSWCMTSLLHSFPDNEGFQYKLQLAELDYGTSSQAAATSVAENYVGQAFDE
jgi:hypothetical protein